MGLAFGNSVWSSSLVLAGFMGGLALGNALAARFGARVRSPLRAYAAAEAAVGLAGAALVCALPGLGAALAPRLGPLLERPWLLDAVRLAAALLLLLVPSTAMGVTLPLLTKALAEREADFGPALGGLYGWNTLGAVAGAITGETLLVGVLGVRGTAFVAAAMCAATACAAEALARRRARPRAGTRTREAGRWARPAPAAGPLAAAFLGGFCLLALE